MTVLKIFKPNPGKLNIIKHILLKVKIQINTKLIIDGGFKTLIPPLSKPPGLKSEKHHN